VLTLVILSGFAAIVGVLTTNQVRGQFYDDVHSAADSLYKQLNGIHYDPRTESFCNQTVSLPDYASAEHAQIRIFDIGTGGVLCTQEQVIKGSKVAVTPAFPMPSVSGSFHELGYRIEARELHVQPALDVMLLYARPVSDIEHTLARVRFFLLLGVLGGSVLALLAGLAIAQRAMRPIAELSDAAREIERTRDPSRRLPRPDADDEIAELARTLEGMLGALDAARTDTEAILDRQREFVADASHELRTPLTSVLANLELLAEELDGEQADTAQAALRSTRRMRRLVGDLLLLARADAKRVAPRRPTDIAEVLIEVAAELGPMADEHELSIDAHRAVVAGVRDDLHRMALNLIENALRHTPPGTHVRAATTTDGADAVLVVQDDGPGVPAELERRLFDRFVRGGGDGGRGSGLGLAIVRAVAESHGGTVSLDRTTAPGALGPSFVNGGGPGTRFVVRIPIRAGRENDEQLEEPQTATTTGSTIGRRRSRS
jgi:signal transduction histidine kinase